ncbi:hypothetical protein V3F56_06805 [Moorellaceae bacterium AZ2]
MRSRQRRDPARVPGQLRPGPERGGRERQVEEKRKRDPFGAGP